jgi:hypothetical protein
MELEISTNINKGLQAIDFNYEAIKSDLTQKLQQYQGLVVTEDGVKEAKKDRATLNNLKKSMDDKRIAAKKLYLAPFDAFEAKVKELVSLVDKPVAAIDAQIKAFEQMEADKKKAEIQTFFDESIGDLKELVTYAQFFNPRWLNSGYKMADIKAEITAAISQLKDNVQIIKELNLVFEQEVLNVLFTTFDLTQALRKKAALEEQQARIAAAKAADEERRARAAEQEKVTWANGSFVAPSAPTSAPSAPPPAQYPVPSHTPYTKAPVTAPAVEDRECNMCISITFRESQRGSVLMLLQAIERHGIKYETAE